MPTAGGDRGVAFRRTHNHLIATVTVRTVIAKLTQGPQSAAPAMTPIAKRGQNDRPNTSPISDRNVCGRILMVRSFPLKFSFVVQCSQERTVSAPGPVSAGSANGEAMAWETRDEPNFPAILPRTVTTHLAKSLERPYSRERRRPSEWYRPGIEILHRLHCSIQCRPSR